MPTDGGRTTTITTIAELEAVYDAPTALATMRKVADHIAAGYAAFIRAAPRRHAGGRGGRRDL